MKKLSSKEQQKRDAKVARFRRGVIGFLLLPVGYFLAELWQISFHAVH
tara:strand:- start:400 stop:543 length:144 start_codon:yes stop_codon:yes gene_type:complete